MDRERARNRQGSSLETASGEQAALAFPPSRGASQRQQPERRNVRYGDAVAPAAAKSDGARSQKIARIRKALAEGSYDISASDVAGKLISHMLGR